MSTWIFLGEDKDIIYLFCPRDWKIFNSSTSRLQTSAAKIGERRKTLGRLVNSRYSPSANIIRVSGHERREEESAEGDEGPGCNPSRWGKHCTSRLSPRFQSY